MTMTPSKLAYRIADFFWLDEPWLFREDKAREIESLLEGHESDGLEDMLHDLEMENTNLQTQLATAQDEIDELVLDLRDARDAIPK